jgi:hypothetical protein
VGATAHVLDTLAPGGTLMLVEPNAADRLEDNLNPVGRMFYAASTMVCTPASRAQDVGPALGAQAGEQRARSRYGGRLQPLAPGLQTRLHLVLEAGS